MAAKITKKFSWLRCLCSFLLATAVAALLCLFLEGPRLAPHYDLLLKRRSPPAISRELLIINSSIPVINSSIFELDLGDDILEPEAAASLLYTMTELGAETLIIQVPILGFSTGGTMGEAEIIHRFDEEFSILSRNIRNLFDGIRTGSVPPLDSARYVGELVDLSESGMERLISALVRRDEEGIISMERAAAFFGHVRRPGDLLVQLIRTGESGHPGALIEENEYSRARLDRDGVLRRISPILTVPVEISDGADAERTLEHIIYGALKGRFENTEIEYTESGSALAARNGPGGIDRIIPLDRNGAVLFELPRGEDDFRRISILDFLAYDEADRRLRRLLSEGEALGIYQNIEGENRPPFLYDFALSLRNEDEEYRQSWINYRNRYIASLENFLYGPAEMNLINYYEQLIAEEPIINEETIQLISMRDALIRSFAALRDGHRELLELRTRLESALDGSFCILGSNMDVEASALLANSILTGRAIRTGEENFLFWGALFSALLICLFIKSRSLASTLGIGLFLCLLAGAGFSLFFIFSGVWLDPLVPTAAGATAVIASFALALIAERRHNRQFRLAYGPAVSTSCLRSLIRAGEPLPSQVLTVFTAVVAVKNSEAVPVGSSSGSTHANLIFQQRVSDTFRKAGGTITGSEADMLTVCFGSPLERAALAEKETPSPYENNIYANAVPALSAIDIVSEIALQPEYGSWHFGLDIGNCTFSWTALSGYFAHGAPVQKARILSRLAGRYNARIVLSLTARDALPELAMKKLDVLKVTGGAEEPFYSLATNDANS